MQKYPLIVPDFSAVFLFQHGKSMTFSEKIVPVCNCVLYIFRVDACFTAL